MMLSIRFNQSQNASFKLVDTETRSHLLTLIVESFLKSAKL